MSCFAGVGERTREGNDLYIEMSETKLETGEPVISKTALVYGQMNEPPGARARVALSRAHGRRVLPRRGEAGRPPLRRQHLPLHAGGLRGVGAPRPHPERRRLPADALDRDGRAAGAHHLDEQGLDHQRAGHLRARRRPHRPGARDDVRAPRRDDGAQPRAHRDRHLPGRRPARLHLDAARPGRHRPAPLRRRAQGAVDAPEVQGPAGHHRHPRHGRAQRGGQAGRRRARARSSASSRSRSSSPRSSPASTGKYVPLKDTIDGLRGDRAGQARRPARAGVLHGRQHRRGQGEGREAHGQEPEVRMAGQDRARDRHAARGARSGERSTRSRRPACRASSACCRATCRCSRRCARASSRTSRAARPKRVAVGAGFAEAGPDKLVILTDEYTDRERIDPVVVRKELAEVQQELQKLEGVPSSRPRRRARPKPRCRRASSARCSSRARTGSRRSSSSTVIRRRRRSGRTRSSARSRLRRKTSCRLPTRRLPGEGAS